MSVDTQRAPDGRHRLRVRYCETDRMGVTHHGAYIDWFEEARTEWFRERGHSYRAWEEEGIFLQVVDVQLSYLRPTTYDDEIEIEIRIADRGRASVKLDYLVLRLPERELAATGSTKLACVDRDRKLRRIPAVF